MGENELFDVFGRRVGLDDGAVTVDQKNGSCTAGSPIFGPDPVIFLECDEAGPWISVIIESIQSPVGSLIFSRRAYHSKTLVLVLLV